MGDVVDLLELSGGPEDHGIASLWVDWIERSLTVEPQEWVDSVRAAPGLDDGQSWRLLGFVDLASSLVAREGRRELAERAAFALALLEASPLDPRDVIVTADLLPRACEIAGLDFAAVARSGCAPAGELGERCLRWLLQRTPRTPPALYEEVGEGHTFRFERTPSAFDADDLLARLEKHRKDR